MKFSAQRQILSHVIQMAGDTIASKNYMTVLSRILLIVKGNSLLIYSTNGSLFLNSEIEISGNEDGELLVSWDHFSTALRSLSSETIHVHQTENHLVLTPDKGNVRFDIRYTSSKDFPSFPKVESNVFFQCQQHDFVNMIDRCIFAVSSDETRFFMTGVYFTQEDNKLVMIATDGRRLSRSSCVPLDSLPYFEGIIVLPRALRTLQKLVGKEGSVRISVNPHYIRFETDVFILTSQLIEGQFPDYKRVIPSSQKLAIQVSRLSLYNGLRRSSLFSEKSSRIDITFFKGGLRLHSESEELGKAEEEIESSYQGEEMKFAFNYHYLLDSLQVEQEDDISIEFSDPARVITVKSSDKQSFHIIMPMRAG